MTENGGSFAVENFANTVVDSCESTNDLARRLGELGFPHGTWVSARRQGSGRGRLGRRWESLDGNLLLSLIARRPADMALWSWIPLTTAVAVAEALAAKAPTGLRIKWPNDLWLAGAKLGGILCEGIGKRDCAFVVIGLGLNSARAPEGLDQKTASLGMHCDLIREPIRQTVLNALETLASEGPQAIRARYERFALLVAGTRIEWGPVGGPQSEGKVVGLGENGELEVMDSGGKTLKLFAEDVRVRAVP